MDRSLRAAKYAVVVIACVFVWQYCNVHLNYGGRWNGLFLSGDRFEVPAALAAEKVRRISNSPGYDGQFYHYIAHDPLMTEGLSVYVDDPALRWRRILTPGLAALLSLGQSKWIDGAYLLVIYLFLGCGVYWMSLLAMYYGRHPAWGVCFVLVPAVAISIERFTVDISLAALTAGYCYYSVRSRPWPIWLVLTLAPLARETGLILIAAHASRAFLQRRWQELIACIACGLPFLAWITYIASKAAPPTSGWLSLPLAGLIVRSGHLLPLPQGSQALTATVLDYCGVIGVWVALLQSVVLLWQRLRVSASESMGPVEWGIALFTLAAVLLGSPKVWQESYAFARVLSPWLLFLLLVAIRDRRYSFAAPSVLMLLHTAAQATIQMVGGTLRYIFAA